MEKDRNWALVAFLSLILGVPAFLRVEIDFGILLGLLVSGLLVGAYIGLLQLFGHGSAIEVWVSFFVILIFIFVFLPIFERSHPVKLGARPSLSKP